MIGTLPILMTTYHPISILDISIYGYDWDIAYSNGHLSPQNHSCNNCDKVKTLATTLGQARATRHPLKITSQTSPTMGPPHLRCFSRWFWNNYFLVLFIIYSLGCKYKPVSLDVWRDVEERRKEKKAGPLISRIYFGFLIWGSCWGLLVKCFFVSYKHYLLSFRIYSLQKASLRHFCQLKADFYVDFKGKILHNRLEFLKSRFTQNMFWIVVWLFKHWYNRLSYWNKQ